MIISIIYIIIYIIDIIIYIILCLDDFYYILILYYLQTCVTGQTPLLWVQPVQTMFHRKGVGELQPWERGHPSGNLT